MCSSFSDHSLVLIASGFRRPRLLARDAAPEGSNVAAIAGGVGGVGCVLLIIGAVILRKTWHKLAPPEASSSAQAASATSADEPAAASASNKATAAGMSASTPAGAGESTRVPTKAVALNLAEGLARTVSNAQKLGEGSKETIIAILGESAVELAKEVGQVALLANRLVRCTLDGRDLCRVCRLLRSW